MRGSTRRGLWQLAAIGVLGVGLLWPAASSGAPKGGGGGGPKPTTTTSPPATSTTVPPPVAGPIVWSEVTPRVIDTASTDEVTMRMQAASDVTRIVFVREVRIENPALFDVALPPTSHELSKGHDGLWSVTLPAADLLVDYRPGSLHHLVGRLEPYNGEMALNTKIVVLNIRDASVPPVDVQPLTPTMQRSDHVVNLRWDSIFDRLPAEAMQQFYAVVGDSYDFAAVVWPVDYTKDPSSIAVRNTIKGIGQVTFDTGSVFGSAEELETIVDLPRSELLDHAAPTTLHEIAHRYANHLSNRALRDAGKHWPIGSMARGVLGYSGPGGRGSPFPWRFEDNADGTFTMRSAALTGEFNALELYLLGLAEPSEVPAFFVFADPDQARCDGCTWSGPVARGTIGDVIKSDGQRAPAWNGVAQQVRMVTIVLSRGRLLSESEMAFFDRMALRGEGTTRVDYQTGALRGTSLPWTPATGGRSRLEVGVCPTTFTGGASC